MQLSILLPTHRHDLLACSRIAQACSWAGPNIEVIVRDNSGDSQKRQLLPRFQRDHCNIIIAEPCDGPTNFSEILRLARGEFVFPLADDDFCFDHAVAALPGLIETFAKDHSVAGVTGTYAVETSQGSSLVSYQNLESDDIVARVAGYLSYPGPNALVYSPVRREILQRVFAFTKTMPFYFSFHDQISCLLYLLNGKFARLQRLLYLYDMGLWENDESAQRKDFDHYKDAGLDAAINKLHWFLCGFEGAVLVRNSDAFPSHSLTQRQDIADLWFATMFVRFKGNVRRTFDSRLTDEAEKLCAKLRTSTGRLSFHNMLAEVCGFIALSSKTDAQRYFDFWAGVLNKSVPPARHTVAPKA